eukprot:GHVS01009914.1.p1 GENE.GHVS01009914.1~~GHVS01009914.1.p1  ORF type:complete len:497 (+),score=77.43 GHVS01009914.1:88-1491(+)
MDPPPLTLSDDAAVGSCLYGNHNVTTITATTTTATITTTTVISATACGAPSMSIPESCSDSSMSLISCTHPLSPPRPLSDSCPSTAAVPTPLSSPSRSRTGGSSSFLTRNCSFWAPVCSPWWSFQWWNVAKTTNNPPKSSSSFLNRNIDVIPPSSPSACRRKHSSSFSPPSSSSPTFRLRTLLPFSHEPLWWCSYDAAQSSYRLATTFFIPTFITSLWGDQTDGGKMTAESFWNYLQVAATVVVCFSYLTFCSVSEFGSLKRKMLFVFCIGGAVSTALMASADAPKLALLVGVLYVISRLCERCGTIFYDALLKPISYAHSKNPNSLSAEGVACGYIGLLTYAVLTTATLVPAAIITHPETQQAYEGLQGWLNFRIPLVICGLWWICFMLVTFFGLRDYPGKAYPYKIKGPCHFLYFAFSEGARQQWQALGALFHMQDLGFYTLAWLFLSDAFSTCHAPTVAHADTP